VQLVRGNEYPPKQFPKLQEPVLSLSPYKTFQLRRLSKSRHQRITFDEDRLVVLIEGLDLFLERQPAPQNVFSYKGKSPISPDNGLSQRLHSEAVALNAFHQVHHICRCVCTLVRCQNLHLLCHLGSLIAQLRAPVSRRLQLLRQIITLFLQGLASPCSVPALRRGSRPRLVSIPAQVCLPSLPVV
jgi:hypothetical protein